MKPRHVPMRTCAGCRETHAKRDLVRVVRTFSGSIVVDETGRQAGRGTYLCSRRECWAQALKSGSIARVLRSAIPQTDLTALQSYAERFGASGQQQSEPHSANSEQQPSPSKGEGGRA